ncbi:MAG: sensor histidine kinase, partial [Candidatus Velamenicoccus archaeovorus]
MGRPGRFDGGSASGLSADDRRTERTVALIRLAVIAVVGAVYLSSVGIERDLGRPAVGVLLAAGLYALWALLGRPYESLPPTTYRAATLIIDALLITVWTHATGGRDSEFWTLYVIAVIAVALRFDWAETVGAALGLSVLYVLLITVEGGIPSAPLLARPAVMVIMGFAVGGLVEQRRLHQERQAVLAALIEERTRALTEEQALTARLREVDLAKTEFVAVASHEFRTPLAAILGVLTTLRSHEGSLDPEIREELLDGAAVQATRLSRLVEDLLTVSRIEEGIVTLDVRPVELEGLIAEAAQASRTTERLVVEREGVDRVDADADRLIRVLTNLLDNARKYSPPEGAIFLTVTEGAGEVTFRVRDQGPGIPRERREEVFERFRRLVDRPQKPGAGLGLYITRTLVEAHGGRIRVDEAPGGG